MNKPMCGTCRYFASGISNQVGYCFANPPTLVLRAPLEPGDPDTVEWARPQVFQTTLVADCGNACHGAVTGQTPTTNLSPTNQTPYGARLRHPGGTRRRNASPTAGNLLPCRGFTLI